MHRVEPPWGRSIGLLLPEGLSQPSPCLAEGQGQPGLSGSTAHPCLCPLPLSPFPPVSLLPCARLGCELHSASLGRSCWLHGLCGHLLGKHPLENNGLLFAPGALCIGISAWIDLIFLF